jgi:hypothetical protein
VLAEVVRRPFNMAAMTPSKMAAIQYGRREVMKTHKNRLFLKQSAV